MCFFFQIALEGSLLAVGPSFPHTLTSQTHLNACLKIWKNTIVGIQVYGVHVFQRT